MPLVVDAGDRKILIAAGIMLVVLAGGSFLASPPRSDAIQYPSSYSPASQGSKAIYLLLQDLGYSVERWERPPTELPDPPEGDVLVLADPFLPISDGERAAVRRFVQDGGRVLATGHQGADLVESWNDKVHAAPGRPWKTFKAAIPSPMTMGVPEITMAPEALYFTPLGPPPGQFGDGEETVVMTRRLGDGLLVWWAGATPLTNAGAPETSNLELALASLGAPGEGRVLWDEYYHGQRGSLWTYLASTPVPWGFLQAAFIFVAAVATHGRRWGPVRACFEEPRLSPLEFVETVSDLYRRARASSGAVEIVYAPFRAALARRLGLQPAADALEIYRRAEERLRLSDRTLLDTLRAAERAVHDPALDDWQALQLVQSLHAHGRALSLNVPDVKESR